MEPIGFHPPPDVEVWRRRVQTAFSALIDSMTPGHGDPLPPDVPPSLRPGQWPDIPAHTIPAMTVRHQLTVLRTIAGNSRTNSVFPRQPADVAAWTGRVQAAFDALNHGAAMAMPDAYRTAPPPPPPPKKPPTPRAKKGASKSSAAPRAAAGKRSHARKAAPKKGAPKKAAPKKAAPNKVSPRKVAATRGRSKR